MEILKDFTEAEKLLRTTPEVGNVDNTFANTGIVLSLAKTMPVPHRLMLENLTGVDVYTDEKLYDYLSKTMEIKDSEVTKFTLELMVSIIPEPEKFVDELINDIVKER